SCHSMSSSFDIFLSRSWGVRHQWSIMTSFRSPNPQREDAARPAVPRPGKAQGDGGADVTRYRTLAGEFAARRTGNNRGANPLERGADTTSRPPSEPDRTPTSRSSLPPRPARSCRMHLSAGGMLTVLVFFAAGAAWLDRTFGDSGRPTLQSLHLSRSELSGAPARFATTVEAAGSDSPAVADLLATLESILIDQAAAQGHAMAEVRHAPQNANGLSAADSNQRAEEGPHATVSDEQPTVRTDSHGSST